MDSEDTLATRVRNAKRDKAGLLQDATVLVSVLGTLMAFVAALLAMGALMYAVATKDRVDHLEDSHDLTQVYVRDLKAYMIEQGFKPPEDDNE